MSGGTWGSRDAAAEWERVTSARAQFFAPATERMLDLAGIAAGSHVLDIGAGAGETSLLAARRVGPGGFVLATDISATMLELATIAAFDQGLTQFQTRVMDAQNLELGSDSFDVAISRFALMLVPDIGRALREIHRVLRAGGRLAALVFARCPYLSLPHAVARRVGYVTSAPKPFGEFRLAAPGVMQYMYEHVGFRDVAVHEMSTRRRFPSLAAAIDYAKNSPLPLRELLAQLTPAQQDQAWREIEVELAQFVGADGFESPCDLLIGVGTK